MLLQERIGAGQQGVFQHIDGRAELLPQSSAQRRLHRLFSHNVCSFLLLFSTYYHQKRSEATLISTVSFSRVTFFAQFECAPLSRIIWRGVLSSVSQFSCSSSLLLVMVSGNQGALTLVLLAKKTKRGGLIRGKECFFGEKSKVVS